MGEEVESQIVNADQVLRHVCAGSPPATDAATKRKQARAFLMQLLGLPRVF